MQAFERGRGGGEKMAGIRGWDGYVRVFGRDGGENAADTRDGGTNPVRTAVCEGHTSTEGKAC